jgi:hypothetical protein
MHHVLFFKVHGDFDWSAAATIIAGFIAGVITGVGVLLGLLANSASARRQRRIEIYGEGIHAVSDYLEGPYRVARCHNSPEQRFALASDLSEVQGRIDAHVLLIRLHSSTRIADAFDAYVAASRREAGEQMQERWRGRSAKRHIDMDMNVRFDRTQSEAAKLMLVDAMKKDAKPGLRFWAWFS